MYFFSNPVGIIIALVFLVGALVVVGLAKGLSFKAMIITGIGYFSWYIVTLIIVRCFPQLRILSDNLAIYGIGSIILLEVISNVIIGYFDSH